MHGKIYARFFAVLMIAFMSVSLITPVTASAEEDGRIFSKSWFEENWGNIYNDVGAFDAINVTLTPTTSSGYSYNGEVEPFYGAGDFTMMQGHLEPFLITIQQNFIQHRGGQPSQSDFDNNHGLYEWYWLSRIAYQLDNVESGTDDNVMHYFAGSLGVLPGLSREEFLISPFELGWVPSVMMLVEDMNSTPVDSRATKLKALSEYIETIPTDYLDRPSHWAQNYKDMVTPATTFVQNSLSNYYDRSWLDEVFTYDATLSQEGSIESMARQWMQRDPVLEATNEDAVYNYVYDRLKYLSDVRTHVRAQMSRVPDGYFNNVITTEGELGTVEENLSKLVRNVSDKLRSLLDGNMVRFENIIYGRVKTGVENVGVTVNNFSFELEKKNMYGIAGAWVYALLRGIFIIGILAFFMYYLSKEAMSVSAKDRSKLKENIGFALLAILLMYAMPNLVDLFIHIRDSILHAIAKQFQGSAFEAMGGLADNFKAQALASRGFVDACEYMGIVIITVYLAFVYIGMACAMTIVFGFFPMFVIFSFKDHKILNEWITFVLGVIATPLIDAVLFVIPLIASRMNVASDIVKLILCMSIIPARGMVRRLLGFSSSTGAELVGLGAIMAGGRAIGALARTARNTVGSVASGASSIMEDTRNARLHEELATESASASAAALSFGSEGADPSSPLARTIDTIGGGPGGGRSSGGAMSPGVSAIYNKRVRPGNFEENLNNIDHATAAKMYRQRARKTAAQTLFRTAGSVQGGLAGGALGLGASTFLGTNAAMMLGSGGMAMGSEVGSAAGHVAGTAAYGIGEVAGNATYSAYTHHTTGAFASVIDAATSAEGVPAGPEWEIKYDENGNPVNTETVNIDGEDYVVPVYDLRQGIIGDGAVATMNNIMKNDDLISNVISEDFNNALYADTGDYSKNEEMLINSFEKYGEVAAACQGDDRMQYMERAYVPAGTPYQTFNVMRDFLGLAADARIGSDGKMILPNAENRPEPKEWEKLKPAFPNIHNAYTATSYTDDSGKQYTPKDGYIGSGMIRNMRPIIKDTSPEPKYGENVKKKGDAGAETLKVKNKMSDGEYDDFMNDVNADNGSV